MQEPIPGTTVPLHPWLIITGGPLVTTQTSTEGHVIGDFATDCVQLSADLAKTIVEAAEAILLCDLSRMTIVSKMFHSAGGKAGLGVAILSSVPAPEDFERAAKDVLYRVSPKEHHLAPRDGGPAQVRADEFLARHGGKPMPKTLVASVGTDEIELSGRLPSPAERPDIKPEIFTIDGKVEGLRKKIRTVFIDVVNGKSMTCKFDESEFFERLVEALGDGKLYRFAIAVENDGTDKPELVLKSIDALNGALEF